jgi:hypothetical protein
MIKNSILFFSDTEKTIRNYRSELMHLIYLNKCEVKIATLRNLHLKFFNILYCSLIISSNMRANLVSLSLFFFKKKLIIINGLGRLKEFKLLRKIFFCLLLYSFRTKIIVQNYRDYRWLRLHNVNCTFIMGSGGRRFDVTHKKKEWVVISRDSKIKAQEKSIVSFASLFLNNTNKLIFYGIDSDSNLNKKIKSYSVFNGFVNPKEFFLESCNFFQPDGYAEGFPHTLADAIMSGCNICISHKQYIQLGIYKLKPKKSVFKNFIMLDSKNNDKLSESLSSEEVNKKYLLAIKEIIDFEL